jgi:hypothetical protein
MSTIEKAKILRDAGWEDTGDGYWRRPPTGRKRIGRLFDSTNQAYNAMMRKTSEKP